MKLTDIDGVEFMLYGDMVKTIFDRKAYRVVETHIGDTFLVKESVNEIIKRIREDKAK